MKWKSRPFNEAEMLKEEYAMVEGHGLELHCRVEAEGLFRMRGPQSSEVVEVVHDAK